MQERNPLREKLIFHINEVSNGTGRLTPRSFHHDILPKFPISLHGEVIKMFFEVTTIVTNKWVYHELKDEYASKEPLQT